MNSRAATALSACLLAACLDDLLEAPYVLATGLGEARGLSPSTRETMLVASATGTWEVAGDGSRHLLLPGPARAVTVHPDRIEVLGEDAVRWGRLPPLGRTLETEGTLPAQGVTDLLAWCHGQVLLADRTGITAWDPDAGQTWSFATVDGGVRSLALPTTKVCEVVLALTPTALLEVRADGARVLVSGLLDARAVTVDHRGRPWVLHGRPPVAAVLDGGTLHIRAERLGDVRDLRFGHGGLFPPENAYLADASGTLDYARLLQP